MLEIVKRCVLVFVLVDAGCFARRVPHEEEFGQRSELQDRDDDMHERHPRTDAGMSASGTSSRDASADSLDRAAPIVVSLEDPSCDGRRLMLNEALTWMADGKASLWHICYETPTQATSRHRRAANRTYMVLPHRMDVPTRNLVQIGVVERELMDTPWTVNMIIALPYDMPAFLNLDTWDEEGAHLWSVQETQVGGLLLMHGIIHLWRVDAEGRQTPITIDFFCRDPRPASSPPTISFFVPGGACDDKAPCPLDHFVCEAHHYPR